MTGPEEVAGLFADDEGLSDEMRAVYERIWRNITGADADDDDGQNDGQAGVREPRRPIEPQDSPGTALEPPTH